MQKRSTTIAIRTPEGRRAVLNADNFDGRLHEKWDDSPARSQGGDSNLDSLSLAELRDMAKRLRIPGRGRWQTKNTFRAGIAAHLKKKEG